MNRSITQGRAREMRGLICPKCGCQHFLLVKISQALGYVRRRRECRHCGYRVTTSERIVGATPETQT